MPPLPPISNVYRVVLKFISSGQNVANVLHYTQSTPGQTAVLAELASGLDTLWNLHLKPQTGATVNLSTIDVTDLGPAGVATYTHTPGSARVGTNATPTLPNNVTACISVRTNLRGRSFRGRIYHVGLTEGMVAGDTIATPTVQALEAAYGNIMQVLVGGSSAVYDLGVLSYYTNNQLRGTPVFSRATSVTCDPFVDSQRRRLAGRGA